MAKAAEFTPAAAALAPLVAHVSARRRESADVWTLEIEGAPVAPAAPGQFNMLTAFGVGEIAISVSGDPADSMRLVHTIRAVGPVSSALASLEPGAPIGVRGPYGVGWPMRQAEGQDIAIVAGGLGLAPLRPALYELMAQRARYGRVALYFGARSPDDMIFSDELKAWAARGDIEINVTVDHAPPGWRGHVGVVTDLLAKADFTPGIAMVCGPEVMMRFAGAALCDAGVAARDIHLSMERNMKCAIGQCGRCQFGPTFICRDGPVFSHERIAPLMRRREL